MTQFSEQIQPEPKGKSFKEVAQSLAGKPLSELPKAVAESAPKAKAKSKAKSKSK